MFVTPLSVQSTHIILIHIYIVIIYTNRHTYTSCIWHTIYLFSSRCSTYSNKKTLCQPRNPGPPWAAVLLEDREWMLARRSYLFKLTVYMIKSRQIYVNNLSEWLYNNNQQFKDYLRNTYTQVPGTCMSQVMTKSHNLTFGLYQ